MPDIAKMTPRQRSHFTYLMDVMLRLEWDFHNAIRSNGRVPLAWEEIARETPHQIKEKITLDLDKDVLKFFKAMGKGHGPRINAVLKNFMHARLSGVVEGSETLASYQRDAARNAGARPAFGEIARMLGEEPEPEPERKETTPELVDRVMRLLGKG
ncbi:hypothetical protein GCM10010873_05310 [Cypionkella aquatica]|uniref:BrnA antitoxin of type II toxin-antitoxin system n=1 Tax=Cypionkella aquatica TaxID=1756042 RepID=A0AA37TQY1_9RHOB|nr:BrnA antitoxin family protein [Cypionkella aquatica]GLS85558.1 hypothetical protein GCM10010873_05310 [Cypionkella aquatica]